LKTQFGHGNKRLRLGKIHIGKEQLTPYQFNDAIKARQPYDSRFGTSLIRLDYIGEETIAKAPSQSQTNQQRKQNPLHNYPSMISALNWQMPKIGKPSPKRCSELSLKNFTVAPC